MSAHHTFCVTRAAEARADANAATLDNVRDRCLRAASAWDAMAARAQRTEALREKQAAEKEPAADALREVGAFNTSCNSLF
jgi:hypothetical protein